MLKSGPNFGMQSVAASWPVYCHTDMEKTFRIFLVLPKSKTTGIFSCLILSLDWCDWAVPSYRDFDL